ncbi:serine/threonine protein kinase [Candidatus Protofrankia californiensis]|uniref:Serine/threonine protein kinase n=1 Tax=Candidatus Protofrankia californiensis TaxID=1839754 RepID=A0A1C3PH60_9ACTN|nr:serine/threonine protein kinase [Candidatus Protofrankia californiensis]
MVDGHNRPPRVDVDKDVTSSATWNASTMAAPASSDPTGPMVPPGPAALPVSTMLDGRYQLLSVMRARGPVTLWRGDDRILARPVAVRVVQHADTGAQDCAALDRAAEMLLSAAIGSGRLVHPGAASTYDATSTTTEAGRVSYVVSEWVEGNSLQALSAERPLRPDQATTVLLAVARVLAAAHERGIHHGDLRASDVIISGHGMVKVVDLGTGSVVAALEKGAHSQAEPWADAADRDFDDVRAMGGLLYAALTGHWPLERDSGLPPATKTADGRLYSPRQVRADVPPDLDALTLAALGDDRAHRPVITSAVDLAEALEELAPADGTLDLGRVRFDNEPPMTRAMTTGTSTAGYNVDAFGSDADSYGPPGNTAYPPGDPGGGYRSGYRGSRDHPDNADFPKDQRRHDHDSPARGVPGFLSGYPDDRDTRRPRGPARRRRLLILAGLVVIIAVVTVTSIALTRDTGRKTPAAPAPAPSATTQVGAALPTPSVMAFDPPPGQDGENDADAPKAIDGDPSTVWTTEGYNNTDGRQFGGYAKSGVGLRLDFGKPVTIREMKITFGFGPTAFELRAGDAAANDANAYTVVLPETVATSTTVSVPAAAAHQYWVVWLTKLPTVDGRFKGSVVDVSFRS